jgi:hypothetical protein
MSRIRTAAKRDDNEHEIIATLKQCGATVQKLDEPVDLLVGYRGVNYLIEVKDGNKPPSKQKLRPGQALFMGMWRGQVAKVTNSRESLEVIGVLKRGEK